MGKSEQVNNLGEADGRRLAVEMLIEMREQGADESTIDHADEYREGRPQSNVLTRYLSTARNSGNPAVEVGFLSILEDFIGSSLGGSALDPEGYEEHTEPDAAR